MSRSWRRLDNAAKIFPPTSTRGDPRVFRFACELNEPIAADLLQRALDQAIERFPLYRVVMKKGLFWYYLESSALVPKVKAEHRSPCSPLYHANARSLLFAVSYYRCRINLEIYHVLSDGTGALSFLRAIVLYYLAAAHPNELGSLHIDIESAPEYADANSFDRYYEKTPLLSDIKLAQAYQLRGEKLPNHQMGVVEGVTSVKTLLAKSREMGVTLTELLTAQLMCSIHDSMPLRMEKLPVTVSIPVNLRQFFPSQSLLNFFSIINVSHCFATDGRTLEEVAAHVHTVFEQELQIDRLKKHMNRYSELEHIVPLRSLPLPLKILAMRYAAMMADRGVTAVLSNVGVVHMPPETASYIRLFDVFTSARKMQLCLCSYGDSLMLSSSCRLASVQVQRHFFRALSEWGASVAISTNIEGEGAKR